MCALICDAHAVSQRRPGINTPRLHPKRTKMHTSARPLTQQQQRYKAATLGDLPTEREPDRAGNPIRWYDQQLKTSPIRTKSFSNGIVSALGDALAQVLTTGTIDKTRLLVWYLSGLCYFGPILHQWYNGLAAFDRHMREKHNTPKFFIVIMQITFNQLIGSSIVNAVFIYFLTFANMGAATAFVGAPFMPLDALRAATHQLQTTFFQMMLANCLFWPIPSAANLLLVPLRYRVLFSNTCSLVWKSILSTILNTR